MTDKTCGKSLSARLLDTLDDIRQGILNGEFVQKMLMKGATTEPYRQAAHKRYARIDILSDPYPKICADAISLATTDRERKLCEGIVAGIHEACVVYRREFEAQFGPLDDEVLRQPVPPMGQRYIDLFEKYNTSYLRFLALNLFNNFILVEMYRYVTTHLEYKPSKETEILLWRTYPMDELDQEVRGQLDLYEGRVSDEEYEVLKFIVREVAICEADVQRI